MATAAKGANNAEPVPASTARWIRIDVGVTTIRSSDLRSEAVKTAIVRKSRLCQSHQSSEYRRRKLARQTALTFNQFALVTDSVVIARRSGLAAITQVGNPIVIDSHLGKARYTPRARRRLRGEAYRQRARVTRKGKQAQELPKLCVLGKMHRENAPSTVDT